MSVFHQQQSSQLSVMTDGMYIYLLNTVNCIVRVMDITSEYICMWNDLKQILVYTVKCNSLKSKELLL